MELRLGEKPSEAETAALIRWLNYEHRLHTRCSEAAAASICQLYGLPNFLAPEFALQQQGQQGATEGVTAYAIAFQSACFQVLLYGLRILMRPEPLKDGSTFFATFGFEQFDFEIGVVIHHHDGDAWVQVLSGDECNQMAQQIGVVSMDSMMDA